MKYCRSYCGVACVDGTCPAANREEYEEPYVTARLNCRECFMYKGCEDCCFAGTEYCTEEVDHELGK